MNPNQLSKHIHQVYFGGNWSASNLKQQLEDVNLSEAVTSYKSLNTIAALAFHINYFVFEVSEFLTGKPLQSKDSLSYNHPTFQNEQEWEDWKSQVFRDGQRFVELIALLHQEKMEQAFVEEKYGSYADNLMGIIEHTHYHLGQIALLKKLIRSS